MYVPTRLDVSAQTMALLARACERQASADPTVLLSSMIPGEHVGLVDAFILTSSVQRVLQESAIDGMTVMRWHGLCAAQLPSEPMLVRDVAVHDGSSVVCILLCIEGRGTLSITESSAKEKPTARMQKVQLQQGLCVLYESNVTYKIERSSATYLHCVCSHDSSSSHVAVFHPVRFPCPYNNETQLGDVRAYPRRFEPSHTACTYRGTKWKNVLDHLMYCSAKPRTEQCLASKKKRRERNEERVQCEFCGLPPMLRNTYIQHRRRTHKPAASLESVLDTFADAMRSPQQTDADDNSVRSPQQTDADDNLVRSPQQTDTDDALGDFDWFLSSDTIATAVALPQPTPKMLRRRLLGASPAPTQSILAQFEMCLTSETDSTPQHQDRLQTENDFAEGLQPFSEERTYEAVARLLESITPADVRQPSGRMDRNAGEMTSHGVTAILAAFGSILEDDVFVDVGSGIGNVVLQVALQSNFVKVVGIEMRSELTALATNILDNNVNEERRLSKVRIVAADITQVDVAEISDVRDVTFLFSHNTVFSPEAMLALQDLCCWLPKLRRIAITLLPCSRHSGRCSLQFCRFWNLEDTISVPVTYTDSLVKVYIFKKSTCLQV